MTGILVMQNLAMAMMIDYCSRYSDQNNKYITTCRHTFMVFDSDDYQSLTLKLKRDDGAVIYFNGYEIIRDNMPSGTIYYDTFARFCR